MRGERNFSRSERDSTDGSRPMSEYQKFGRQLMHHYSVTTRQPKTAYSYLRRHRRSLRIEMQTGGAVTQSVPRTSGIAMQAIEENTE